MADVTTTGALIIAVVALAKVVDWLIKRYSDKKSETKTTICPMGHDQLRQIRENHERMILVVRDIESMKDSSTEIAAAMRDIADCIQKVSESNAKVAELVEKIDRRQEVEDEIRRRAPHVVAVD